MKTVVALLLQAVVVRSSSLLRLGQASAQGPACKQNCGGRGVCTAEGTCRCLPGYSGDACQSFCPNECSRQGLCIEGSCLCFAGFKGADCSAKSCCNGRGSCEVPGTCICNPGWGGTECKEQLTCPDPTCSGQGTCSGGKCICNEGFTGDKCQSFGQSCTPACGATGKCDRASKTCVCDAGYTGADCNTKILTCPKNCNNKGLCLNGVCMCGAGWSGEDCSRRFFTKSTGKLNGLSVPDVLPTASGVNPIEQMEKDLGPEPVMDLNGRLVPAKPAPAAAAAAAPAPAAAR